MELFDRISRNYLGPQPYAEPRFSFLNRSARPEVDRVRSVLEDWFSHYSHGGQADIVGRFRSDDERQHYSAFFELFLHELLLQLDCSLVIHPIVNEGMPRHPEFLVTPRHGTSFYLEAITAHEMSDEAFAALARKRAVYDTLNRLDSPNFFLWMNLQGEPKTSPPGRQMADFLNKELKKLDPDRVAEQFQSGGLDALPKWPFELGGWKIEFSPIPKKADARGKPGVRPIGIQFSGFRLVRIKDAIKDAILDKADRYGRPDLPYVVAVNAIEGIESPGSTVDEEDICDALLGTSQWVFEIKDIGAGPGASKYKRVPDGAWTSKSGPINTQVSAVLMATPVLPWNVPQAPIRLYHNPWAALPYTSVLTCLPQVVKRGEEYVKVDGRLLGEIFSLPSVWPGGA